MLGVDWPRLLTTRGLPFGLAGVFLLIVPSLLGTGTHLLWDGLTHDGLWPACVLYPDVTFNLFGKVTELDRALWWLSTVGGAVIVFAWTLIRFKGPVRAEGGDVKWLAMVLLLPLSAFALYLFNPGGNGSDYANTWISLVTTARVCAAMLTVLCLAHRLSQPSPWKKPLALPPEEQTGKRGSGP